MNNFEKILVNVNNIKYSIITTDKIACDESFRDICVKNTCKSYNRNYCCPPFMGEAKECIKTIREYESAILYQMIFDIEDSYDYEGMIEGSHKFKAKQIEIQKQINKTDNVNYLHLGAGPCKLCEKCACLTNEECRHPELAIKSMDSYCIYVSKTAENAGLKYNNGPNTITYFGMVLY